MLNSRIHSKLGQAKEKVEEAQRHPQLRRIWDVPDDAQYIVTQFRDIGTAVNNIIVRVRRWLGVLLLADYPVV